jgi:hypothetical protein
MELKEKRTEKRCGARNLPTSLDRNIVNNQRKKSTSQTFKKTEL